MRDRLVGDGGAGTPPWGEGDARAIRIFHVIHTLRVGGLENGVVNLVNHTDASRFRHQICCLTESGPLAARIRDRSTVVHELRKRPGQDWTVYPRLRSILRRARPHIVHTRNWGTIDLVVAARWAGVPAVVHGEHGWDAGDVRGTRRKGVLLRRAMAPFTDRWIAVSEDIRQWLIATVRLPGAKITTIRNGVDTDRFHPRPEPGSGTGADASRPFVIGTVGRLDPIKAQRDLVAAFAIAARGRPNLRLLIVGDGPMRRALEEDRDRLGLGATIEMVGEVARPEDFYARLDLFALPSLNEGISNTILEAMATGLPVVATAVGGNPELVREDVSGSLVPPSDPVVLAAALGRYADDPALRRAHGDAARRRAVEEFSIARMVERYEALYEELHRARIAFRGGAGRPPTARVRET